MNERSSGDVGRATRAGMWSVVDLVGRQLLQFASSVVLARLLTPADFGLIVLVVFFSTLSTVFVQGGLATALIQQRDTTREEESTVFWFNLAASVVFAAAIAGFAPAIARFYEAPLLAPLLLVACVSIVLSALGAVHGALLTRELMFAPVTKVGLLSTGVGTGLALALALSGWGVWSIAAQIIAGAVINTAGYWLVCAWRPLFAFHLAGIARFFRFGAWLSLSHVMEVLYSQGASALIGKLYGVSEVGVFNRAVSTQLLPSGAIMALISRLALPLFVQNGQDPASLRNGLRVANGLSMLVNVPAMLGLILLAPLVIRTLFGDQWNAAAPLLSILALYGLSLPLHAANLQVLLAAGATDVYFRVEVLKKLVGFACLAGGSFFGLAGLAWAQVALSVIALFINIVPVGRRIDYGLARQLGDLKGLLLPSLAMAAVVLALQSSLALGDVALLVVLTVAGAVTYAAVGLATRGRPFVEAWAAVSSLRKGEERPVAA